MEYITQKEGGSRLFVCKIGQGRVDLRFVAIIGDLLSAPKPRPVQHQSIGQDQTATWILEAIRTGEVKTVKEAEQWLLDFMGYDPDLEPFPSIENPEYLETIFSKDTPDSIDS